MSKRSNGPLFRDESPPVPAVVIAVGDFAKNAVMPARDMYLRGDPRRQPVTVFFTLGCEGNQENTLSSLIELSGLADETNPERQSHAAFHAVLQQSGAARAALDRAVHDVRIHESLLAAGWPAASNVPVNVYLIADLTDAIAVGCLFPLVALIQAICSFDWMCRSFLLLNTAVFPAATDEVGNLQEARVSQALQDMHALLDDRTAEWQMLAKCMNVSQPEGIPPAIFLFDRRKEGSAEVKDSESMELLMGNGLMALLEGNTARILAGNLSQGLNEEPSYISLGASMSVYNPASAQAACAVRAASAFVETWLLGDNPQDQVCERLVEQLWSRLGNPSLWLAEIAAAISPETGSIALGDNPLSLRASLASLQFQPLDLEKLPALNWDSSLQDYAANLERTLLPAAAKVAKETAQMLAARLRADLRRESRNMIRTPQLYPGGLRAAVQILARIEEKLLACRADVQHAIGKGQGSCGCMEAAAEIAQQMRHTIACFQKPPWIFRLIPANARPKMVQIFELWKYRREVQKLLNLRMDGVQMLESRFALALANAALADLLQVVDSLVDEVKSASEYVVALERRVQEAAETLVLSNERSQNDNKQQRWDELFRAPAARSGWVERAYQQALPSFDTWLVDLVADDAPLFCDSGLHADTLAGWLLRRSMDAYRHFWDYSVDRVLEEQGVVTDAWVAGQMAAALPALRPDFDAAGGAQIRSLSCMIGMPDWELSRLPANAAPLWEVRSTGNPYVAVWLQARAGVTAAAVAKLWTGERSAKASGPRCWSILSDAEEIEPAAVDAGGSELRFSWSFRPRGGKENIPQQVRLQIDRARYEFYRRQPRHNGQWNLYAEEEMTEVRSLALAFQTLHVRRRWSTYTQASNVLAFVQQCIPYSRDVETTGHADWPRYPIETLVDRTGDCEDVAILCAAVLARLGFQVILLVYEHHIAFAVAGAEKRKGDYIVNPFTGARCFYGEATAQGWRLGQVPEKYAGIAPVQVLPVTILLDDGPDTGADER